MVVDPSGPGVPVRASGAAGSASPRAAGSAAWPARRPTPGGSTEVVALAGGDAESVRGEHVTAGRQGRRPRGPGGAGGARVVAGPGPRQPGASASTPPSWSTAGGWSRRVTLVLDAGARRLRRAASRDAPHRPEVMIVPAQLGERAGAIGAALVARAGRPLPRRRGLTPGAPAPCGSGSRCRRFATTPPPSTRPVGPKSSASTGCSCSTTCGPWARPSAPPCRPSPCSGRWPRSTERVCFGPLVARVGLVPDERPRGRAGCRWPPWRRAGSSPGSAPATARARPRTSPTASPSTRPTSAGWRWRACARSVLGSGVPVWVGGGSTATTELAVELGRGRQPVGGPARGAWPRCAAGAR